MPRFRRDDLFSQETASYSQSYFMNFVPSGYPVEIDEIITDDGYKLNAFRIQAKGTYIKAELHLILIQHVGLDNSCLSWVMNSQEKSIALINMSFTRKIPEFCCTVGSS